MIVLRRISFAALFLVTVVSGVTGQSGVPTIMEEVVVGLHPFNGRNYLEATFSHSERDTVYFLADSDNFVRVIKTFVYFWPLTSDWRTDEQQLDHTFDGQLVLNDSSGTREIIASTRYTYFSVPGRFEGEVDWLVKTGQEAEDEISGLRRMISAYSLEQQARVRQAARLQDDFNNMLAEITRARQNGEDIAPLVAIAEQIDSEISALRQPGPRPWEDRYATPPRRLERGYILNVPVGSYSIHFEDAAGRTLENSYKNVVAFEPRRSGSIGFEILPGDSYTEPVVSSEPGSTIYIDGTTEFYVKSFVQNEYNDLYFNKMVDQDSSGNSNIYRWVRIYEQRDPSVRIDHRTGASTRIEPADYLVRQTPGTSLGYTIREIENSAAMGDDRPTFRGVRIDPADLRRENVFVVETVGGASDGERNIRVVDADVSRIPVLLFVVLPLFTFGVVRVTRKRFLSQFRR